MSSEQPAVATEATTQLADQSTNQSTNQSNNQSSDQSSNEPTTDFWDFLDTPEMKELLAKKAETLPTDKQAINTYLESMPIMTTVKDEKIIDQSSDLQAIEALVGDEQVEDRVESFKQSGNEAYKLAVKMKQEADAIEIKLKQYEDLVAQSDNQSINQSIKELSINQSNNQSNNQSIDPTTIYATKQARDIDQDKMERQRVAYHKRLTDAYQYYTQAIELKTFLPILNASCYSNRALISMIRENYGDCLNDCATAVKTDQTNSKAFYRGAYSLYKMGKFDSSIKWIDQGLTVKHLPQSEKTAFQKLRQLIDQSIKQAAERQKQKEAKQQEKLKKNESINQSINQALKQRGLTLGPSMFDLDESDNQYNQSINVAANGSLNFPLLFLYPTHYQSDSINQHSELAPLQPIIDQMFPSGKQSNKQTVQPPPWDTYNEFKSDQLDIFVATSIPANESMIKVINQSIKQSDYARMNPQDDTLMVRCDPKQSLLACLTQPILLKHKYAIPGIPTFLVVPKKK